MADNNKPKFDIPWVTLLPVIAALAGIIAQYKPLVSTRPAIPSDKSIEVIAAQDVDARLWQDPLAVAQKQKAALDTEMATRQVPASRVQRHQIEALINRIRLSAPAPEKNAGARVLLLAVMLDSGPYSEQGESRLRARQAVLEGLSRSGFVPADGEHLGFVSAPWPPTEQNTWSNSYSAESGLLIPWEECEAWNDPQRGRAKNTTKRVIVLWLPAASFNPVPLQRFAALIDKLTGDVRDNIEVKLIGPANSTGLQNMIREVRKEPLGNDAQKALDGVSIISPRATAPDATLLYEPFPSLESGVRSQNEEESVQALLEGSIPRGPRGGLQFLRTIATDDVVLKEMIAELERRRVPIRSQVVPQGSQVSKVPNHVVILTEWDTPYGRSLGTAFAARAADLSVNGMIKDPEKRPKWIHSYYYLRGIDGQLPGDSGKESQRDQAQKTQLGQDTVAVEATEGLNQSDYLRRLARKLKEDNERWQSEDRFGIRAIGLLGSDIYDKLMILRALRPEFRNAIFFTNNYDAHFERRDDLDDTRNLIVVSPFGSTIPDYRGGNKLRQQRVAPFRDSNQTSMYIGTLVATGQMDQQEAECFSRQPRVFEISRQGAYDLSPPWHGCSKAEVEPKSANVRIDFRDWLFTPGVIFRLTIVALALLALAAWISVTIASRRLPGGGTTPQRLGRALTSTVFWLVCGAPLIVLLVSVFSQYGSAAEEPLAFFSGISIWPTEMLRLIVFVLAIHFMIKARLDLRANERKITKDFCLTPLGPTPFRWQHLGIGLEQWRTKSPDNSGKEMQLSAEEAWHAYLCRNKFGPRFIRIGILSTLYFVFALTVVSLFPLVSPPARGEMAFQFDTVAIFLAAIAMMILSFYVVDAIQLNSNFIRMFAREVTRWGDSVAKLSRRSPPLDEEELSAYHEIFFVAQRTQAVAPLIWYPLVLLSLIFVARSSFFDNWTWPASLILIFALNAVWPIGSAVLLRRAAEQLRDEALSSLQAWRIMGRGIEEKRVTFDELIAEIRNLKKGAFAPLSEQPFVHAIIFPSGGLGLLAVAQRLLGIF